jgi:hypothetical protein
MARDLDVADAAPISAAVRERSRRFDDLPPVVPELPNTPELRSGVTVYFGVNVAAAMYANPTNPPNA